MDDHLELHDAARMPVGARPVVPHPPPLQERQPAVWPFTRSRKVDDHLELDDAARMPVGARTVIPHPPPLQECSSDSSSSSDPLQGMEHVSQDYVKHVEMQINSVLLPKYGTDKSEHPPTIYKVPEEIKYGNMPAYLPIAVEIGPFWRYGNVFCRVGDADKFQRLQAYKWCCIRRLIGRHHLLHERERTPALLHRCLNSLRSLEPRIRASYQMDLKSSYDADLVLNMLLDGCFILQRLLKYAHIAKREASRKEVEIEDEDEDWTQVFGRCWVWGFVTNDLLLLENQIPFFVVQSLFHDLRTDPDESSDILVAGALRLFRSLRPQPLPSFHIACHDVHHLLHLFYLSVVGLPAAGTPSGRDNDLRRYGTPPSELSQWMPCARELEEAGVKLQAREGGGASISFLDVRFNAGVLEIPVLHLYDNSEHLLRNLIAFEQTYPLTPGRVTAYAVFMDCLVASPEDMRLLQLRGVLTNQMNGVRDKDQTGFFSDLCHGVHVSSDRNYLAGVIAEVNKYRQARWPRWRTALVRSYFSNPWVATSLAAAVFLLALTFIQAFFAAYSYFKPPH
ncbi:hypothetical protein PVAP13_6KG112140 [Panicum virgatum]|uniref:Uncharacterized protein n=2 Tax=Panicum virgatum TaxID=38727 RepID=A0A8T0RBI0_PANVG|nr:hypothetical protein PVAP13_6KG112140 [Panicum virgatum]